MSVHTHSNTLIGTQKCDKELLVFHVLVIILRICFVCVCAQGRKSVRYGDFQFCEQAKSVIVVSVSKFGK